MKSPLWSLLFLSLCVPSRSDCHGDCLTCGPLLSQHQAFSTLVCLLECEAQPLQTHTRDMCFRAVGLNPALEGAMQKRSAAEGREKLAVVSVEDDGGVEDSEVLERFRHSAQALASRQTSGEALDSDWLGPPYGFELDSRTEEEEEQEQQEEGGANLEAEPDVDSNPDMSKRFGGFVKGRHSFRKLVSSGRPLQKRYGGFIGIRKSARKWNNQKRVSQLLRQYLTLTSRPGRYNHPAPAGLRQKIGV